MDIVNLSEMDPGWNWLSAVATHTESLHWRHASTQSETAPPVMPKPVTYQRVIAARRAAALLSAPSSLLVSHGPRMTMYGAIALASRFRARRHLANSFNFTELPHGLTRALMRRAFKHVDRFVCFSTMERELYANHFDLDVARFDMIHWAARPPSPATNRDASLPARYLCAIGSQGRDYRTLMEAMTRLPAIRLVLVATRESLVGATVPSNVEVRCSIPLAESMAVLQGASFNVVPLLGSEVPCGHVTLVAAMHCAKASIVSDSSGVADYVHDELDGLTVAPRDPAALALQIERLWHDPGLADRLGFAAKAFAQAHCSERAAVDYLQNYLKLAPILQAA